MVPVDLVSPEAVGLRVRMLLLSKGMAESKIKERLGLTGRVPDCVFGNVRWTTATYSIGPMHKLDLHYRTAWKNNVPVQEFDSADLRVKEIRWPVPWRP